MGATSVLAHPAHQAMLWGGRVPTTSRSLIKHLTKEFMWVCTDPCGRVIQVRAQHAKTTCIPCIIDEAAFILPKFIPQLRAVHDSAYTEQPPGVLCLPGVSEPGAPQGTSLNSSTCWNLMTRSVDTYHNWPLFSAGHFSPCCPSTRSGHIWGFVQCKRHLHQYIHEDHNHKKWTAPAALFICHGAEEMVNFLLSCRGSVQSWSWFLPFLTPLWN